MNRKELIKFCNEHVWPQVSNPELMTADMMKETVNTIKKWRIGKPINVEMNVTVKNNFLFINGDRIIRLAPYVIKDGYKYTEATEYWEGRCLALVE